MTKITPITATFLECVTRLPFASDSAISEPVRNWGGIPAFSAKKKFCHILLGAVVVWFAVTPVTKAAPKPTNYLGPSALVVSADSGTLFVACADACQLVWVDLSNDQVIRRIEMPATPTGLVLVPGQKRLVVTCAAPRSTAVLIDTSSGQIVDTIPLGHTAVSPAVNSDGTRLYVCNRFDNDVSVIDLVSRRQIRRVPTVREPISAAITPDGKTLFVANHLPDMRTNVSIVEEVTPVITVIDTKTFKTTAIELPNGSHSLRWATISPDGKYVFVAHLLGNFQETPFRVETGWINTNVVSIIDVSGRKRISTIGLDEMDSGGGNPWGITCTRDGRFLCVALSGTDELSVIETAYAVSEDARRTMSPMMGVWPIYLSLSGNPFRRTKLSGKGPRAMATAGSFAYVAQYFSDTVAVVQLDVPGQPECRTIALGPAPKMTSRRRGEYLFGNATLCYQRWQSCTSCHPDGRSDALVWDLLNDGQGNPKNTKSLVLSHKTPPSMATGARASAEDAVRSGLRNILFSNRSEQDAVDIDTYLRSLKPVASPRLIAGRLNSAAKRGRTLFQSDRIGCNRCHRPPYYTDLKSHNVDTKSRSDQAGKFDTPSLIEVWRTAPYLHDGRYTTIRQLLKDGKHGLTRQSNQTLSPSEMNDLIEFVLSL